MKSSRTRLTPRRTILTASIGALIGMAASGSAQTVYWDPLVDGNSQLGGSGTWNLTNLFWDPTGIDPVTADNVVWPNSATAIGVFGGTPGLVTINTGSGLTANGLTFNVSGYTIGSNVAADVLTMAGTTPTITVTNAGQFAQINSIIAGTAGLTYSGAGTVFVGGANTYSGQTIINSGATVSLNAAGALGAIGAGNETIVNAGGTLNLGGQAVSNNPAPGAVTEIIQIAGSGVGGIGALINSGAGQNNAVGKVVLSANATIGAGAGIATSYNAGGQIVTSAGGRFDIRLSAAPTAGQKHLDLAGFTLTKTGSNLLALVNADVSDGNIVINEGQVNFEVGTLVQGSGTITVNQNGKLGFWSSSAAGNITRQIVVNGGTIGDPTSTGAAQTINAPIQFTGALNPNFTAISTNRTTLAGVISQNAFTGTGLDKRGGGLLAFSNTANTFSAPITVYGGTLGADFTTTLNGGVPPGAAVTSTDTPLGTNSTITLAGGTLAIRANMENSNSNQVFDLQRNIVLDRAPNGMSFDRIGNASQTDKHVRVTSLTMAAPSAANGYSIGQNQFTFTQGNTHRIEIPLLTMNSDSVFTTGDHTFTGDVLSANRNSLAHSGGNTLQFISAGTHEFNAFFQLGGTLRIGSGFGTPTTNNTVTVGTGDIYLIPNSVTTFRTPTNIAAGQEIDATISNRLAVPVANFEQFTSVPAALRARGSGIYGIGSATYTNLDLSDVGDGTWRIGANFGGAGNGTINGVITPGQGNVVRVGGGGTVTASATNAVTGSASLEVGAALLNNAQVNNSTGTFLFTSANDYTGGTTVNRGSILRFQSSSLGSGPVSIAGTATAESAGNAGPHGTFVGSGPATFLGGSTLRFVNDAITVDTTPTPDRWSDTSPMNLVNTTVEMRSRNIVAAVDTTEVVGAMTVAGGNTLSLQRLANNTTGHNVQLTVDSLARSNAGTLELTRNTGTGAGYSSGHKFIVTNGAPTPVNGMVAPWIVAQNNGPIEFMNYGANGFSVAATDLTVTTGTYAAGALDYNGTTGGKISVTTADLTLVDDPILYALRTERSLITSGTNDTVTLRSGGMILRNVTDNSTLNIAPAVVANNGTSNTELVVYTAGGGTGRNYQIGGAITANGLTKFGGGNLIIGSANPGLTGTVAVNAGTLELRAATAATLALAGNGSIRLQGGQLNVRGAAGNYTLTNGVTVAQNIAVATLDSNRTDATSTGTATFNPAAQGLGLILEGAAGAQGQTLNVSGANYGVTFGTNALNSFTGNVTINNAVTLQLNNAPNIAGTAPVITKSGAGNLIVAAINGIGAAGNPGAAIAANTTMVVNGGTLELRSLTALGSGTTTSLVLNSGTLNLRRDTTGGTYGGTGTGYPVLVNGSATISADRVGAGSNQNLGLGKLSINTNGVLTVNNANGYYPSFAGANLGGVAVIASNVGAGDQESAARFSSGFDVSGGALVKQGGGHLHLLNANNTYDGGTYINQGTLRARATSALGTGAVYLNPGATIDFNSATNLGPTQPLIVRSNSAYLPMISVNVNGIAHPTANVDTTNAPNGIVGISNGPAGSYDGTIDLSSLYGGGWSFGGVSAGAYDPTYTGASIVAGNNNLYRLGGGGTSFAMGTDSARVARTNVLTGPNNVRLGFDSANILPVNNTNFQYAIAGVNDYSGGSTVIHRGMVARLFSNNDGTRSGLSNSTVDVFGVLSLSGQATLINGVGGHVNTVNLHPGSALFFDNTNGAANTTGAFAAANLGNRWSDTVPIALNSAMINHIGLLEGVSSEAVGDVTFSGGARIRTARTNAATPSGNATSTLTLNSITRSGPGSTLLLQTAAANSLNAATNYDRIIVNTAPTTVNGMVAPYVVNASDHTFVTYGANGFANVAYDTTVGAATIPAGLAATAKVDINFTGGVAVTDNPVVYALRTNRDINMSGPFNTVTIRSGGLIGHANALTINPHLVFNDGTANVEALIYTSNTVNINGTITANGIVKSGNGNLSINVPQTAYSSGWTVNSGTLQINDLEGLGQSIATNTVTVNGALTTGGQASQAFGMTNLTFNRNQGTPELQTFTGGPITVVNEATIRVAGGDDRNLQIPAVTLDSTSTDSSVSFTYDVPNNRFRANIPNLTLNDDAIIRVTDSGSTADTGRITTGAIGQLTGNGKDLVKIGNRTLELTNDNSASFVGGTITVSQGTVRVRHNGSLGSATTATQIERNATLEIAAANFTPVGSVTQLPGSIERWNQEDARGSTYNLPAGVNLQLNTNLVGIRTIGLNGGSLEAFLWIDHPLTAIERTVGSAVTINLLANSSVGQNVIQGQGYDAGRQPITGQPFGDTLNGAYLRIDGNITGNFDLTKTGFDTVTIAGAANTYRNTIVDLGILRLGRNNALPISGVLTTRMNGTLDLYGNNQVVAGLGVAAAATNPGGTGVGSSGRITNSAPTDNTLFVNAVADFTYNGVIEQNVALTKSGGGSLTLGGANTYRGDTNIIDGTLVVTGSISGSEHINVGVGATLDVAAAAGGFVLGANQTLSGEGTIVGSAIIEGVVSPGSSPGVLTLNGAATFNTGSTFALEIGSALAFDKLIATSTSLNGAVNLTLSLGYTPTLNTQFVVLENTGLTAIGGTPGLFTWGGPEGLLTEGEEFTVGASTFSISYAGGSGSNDVVLTAVPEPMSGMMLLGGLALVTARRRRRVA